jgi:hypothetical protein
MVAETEPPAESEAVRVIAPAVVRVKVVEVPVWGLTEPEPVPLMVQVMVPRLPDTEKARVALRATVALVGEMVRSLSLSSSSVVHAAGNGGRCGKSAEAVRLDVGALHGALGIVDGPRAAAAIAGAQRA